MEYLLVKWIHIVSSTILFGTGLGSAFCLFMANRSKDVPSIHFATRTVVVADFLFTRRRLGEMGAGTVFLCRRMLVAGRLDAAQNARHGEACA
jgi:uncharacterized membrane protein